MNSWAASKSAVNDALFGKQHDDTTSAVWPTIRARAPIPRALWSRDATGRPRVAGLGFVKAATGLLTRLIGLHVADDRWSAVIASASTDGTFHRIGGRARAWWVEEPNSYLTATALLLHALTVGVADEDCHEVVERWNAWLDRLKTCLGGDTPPYSGDQLRRAADDATCTDGLLGLADAAYSALLRVAPSLDAQADPSPSGTGMDEVYRRVYRCALPTAAVDVDTSIRATLRRVIRRGGTALLIGPTGSGKTTDALQAAAAENAILVGPIKGMPGLEDRMLYGGQQYLDGQYVFVPGPLAEAFAHAQAGHRTVLLIDELARMDPYHVAAIIGALDRASGHVLRHAHGLQPEQRALLQEHATYYVLQLPTGERLVAPTTLLSVLATSNLGDAYQQIQSTFDPALLRRFDVLLDVDRKDVDERIAIVSAGGIPVDVARVAVQLEQFSTAHTAQAGGLLERELNVGTLLNWVRAANDLVAEGATWTRSLVAAAEMTVIPYACPRLGDGRLEVPAARILRDEVRRLARTVSSTGSAQSPRAGLDEGRV